MAQEAEERATRLVTVEELSERWQVSKPLIYRWLRSGKLPCVRFPGKRAVRIFPEDVEAFVRQHRHAKGGG